MLTAQENDQVVEECTEELYDLEPEVELMFEV